MLWVLIHRHYFNSFISFLNILLNSNQINYQKVKALFKKEQQQNKQKLASVHSPIKWKIWELNSSKTAPRNFTVYHLSLLYCPLVNHECFILTFLMNIYIYSMYICVCVYVCVCVCVCVCMYVYV